MTPDTARRTRPSRWPWRLVAAASAVGLSVLAGCGTSLLGSAATTDPGGSASPTAAGSGPSATPTTVPIDGEVAVAFPVVACTAPTYGGTPVKSRSGWNPSILLAPVPTSLVGKVAFYTDGIHIVLGPTGWTCAQVSSGASAPAGSGAPTASTAPDQVTAVPTSGQNGAIAAPGGTTLAVFPPNDPDPPVSGPPAPGTEGIFATWATTGTDAGVDMVCPFFTLPSWQVQSAGCTTARPGGETADVLTPDVTEVTDPAGVVGNLAGSGGQGPSTGVVLFPQIPSAISYGSPIAVATESCSLADTSLCPTVLSDFDVREFPVPPA